MNPWKSWLILLTLIIFSCKGKNKEQYAGLSAQKLVIRDSIIDLGNVKWKTRVNGKFQIINKSAETINIEKVQTDCECTSTNITKRELSPDESSEITLAYDSTREGLFQSIGMVYIKGLQEPLILLLRGDVVK
jgi:hypothetical protein